MTHWVAIYHGTVAFYRDLSRMTVCGIKSVWIWHDYSGNNIGKNDTGLTGTVHYDIFRSITRLQTAFDTLQLRIPHITIYYICRHILITFVTVLRLITTQWPIESQFIREQSHFIAIYHEWPLVASNLYGFDMTLPGIILERMTQI